MPAKAQLLDALRASGRVLIERLGALPADEFEHGRYESGWNGRQILAHVASIEWTYPRLIDVANQGAAPAAAPPPEVRRTSPDEAAGIPTRPVQGGIDGYNARQVEKRDAHSVAGLLAEFEQNRAATIAAVERADEALLQAPVRSSGGITGALAAVVYAVAVSHILGHTGDILGEPVALPG